MSKQAPSIVDVELGKLGQALAGLRLRSEASLYEMERQLRRHGQLMPVMAYRAGDDIEVVDGFKRLCAARQLGWGSLRTQLTELDGVGATLLVWQSNMSSRPSEIEQAWVVRSLYREQRLTQPRIAQLFGRHKSWVCRRLMLAESLSDAVEASLRLGLVSATMARELARLPRGNQDEAAQAVCRRGLTTRQATRLVGKLLEADQAERQRLLLAPPEQPAVAEQTSHQTAADDNDGKRRKTTATRSHGEWLVSDAAALKRVAARLQARLMERSLSSLGEQAAQLAKQSLSELSSVLLSLQQSLDRALSQEVRNVT